MGVECRGTDRRRRMVDGLTCCLLEDGRGAVLVGSNVPCLFRYVSGCGCHGLVELAQIQDGF